MSRHILGLMAGLWAAIGAAGASAAVMLGAHVGNQIDEHRRVEFHRLEVQIGRQLAIDSDYDDWTVFPDVPRIKWDLQLGRVPMQNWRVVFDNRNPNVCATAADITKGVYDAQITRQANVVKALGGLILVRFNWEMTTNSFNTCFTGFPVKDDIVLAGQEYIAAWDHVVNIFRAVGATNVKWVWAPGAPTFAQRLWSYFYPGSDYVDWIAVDCYNQTLTNSPFESHPGIAEFDAEITPLGKPMMISENGAFNAPRMNPDPQTEWITTAADYMKRHPEIRAYVYWDSSTSVPPPPPYNGTGFRLSGPGLAAFSVMANDPYFGATGP